MTDFFTADFHLGHKNIIKYCNRPFLDVEEMDDTIIQNINAEVTKSDRLYILGDFCWFENFSKIKEYRDRINCGTIFLIRGNHDKRSIQSLEQIFNGVFDQKLIDVSGQKIFLNHYSMRVWAVSHHNSWHLWGHSHGTLPAYGLSFDVGVDAHDFKAWSYLQVVEKMAARQEDLERADWGIPL